MSEDEKRTLNNIFWDNDCNHWYMYDETYYEIIKLIYRLIKELEQEKEKNKELQKENEELSGLYNNDEIQMLLNQIDKLGNECEKLQKENDILQTNYEILHMCGFYDGEKKWKDKIRAKIEELEDQEDWYIKNKCLDDLYGRIDELKELLEE